MGDYEKLVDYWRQTASHDYDTMESLFKSKRFSDALFFGHIVLEKVLKALIVQRSKEHAPYTHNLLVLVEKTGVKFKKEQLKLLVEINRFNIRARYPDIKLSFYKTATASYTKNYIQSIKSLYHFLCQKLHKK